MLIRRVKYHSDISAAYTRGLEQGYELARQLRQYRDETRQEPYSPNDIHPLEESPLLLQQLVDIAERKVIKLR
jgi:hypothetical protein